MTVESPVVDGLRGGLLLGTVNDVFWIADEANLEPDWIPSEWADTLGPGDDLITLVDLLSADSKEMTATTAGRSVVYHHMTADDPVLECA